MSTQYVYGIALRRCIEAGEGVVVHREGMTRLNAEKWLREWREVCVADNERDMFVMVRKPMGTWKVID